MSIARVRSRGVLAVLLTVACLCGGARAQTLEARVFAGSGSWNDLFGTSVAIDGELAVVGSPAHVNGGVQAGAAFVFYRHEGVWVQEAELFPADPVSVLPAEFGRSVAISGSRLVVGAPSADSSLPFSGAAYVFKRSGTFPFAVWTQKAKLTPSAPESWDKTGMSVAIDGQRIAVGSRDRSATGGAVLVFENLSQVWTERAELRGLDTTFQDWFGQSVALRGDVLLVGAPQDDDNGPQSGAAFVFTLANGIWSQTAKLLPADGDFDDAFGTQVALDDDRALVGAPFDEDVSDSGSAYLFTREQGVWSQTTKLMPGAGVFGERFGASVAFASEDLVVGAPHKSDVNQHGVVYVFRRIANVWVELGLLRAQHAGTFGDSLAASAQTVVLGAPTDWGATPSSGTAFIHSLAPPVPELYCTPKISSLGCLPAMAFTGSASITSSSAFLVEAREIVSRRNGMLFYGTSAALSVPFQGGTLCVQPRLHRTPIQNSGGNPPPADCSGTFAYDFNARIRSGADAELEPGVTVFTQYWYRDPASSSTTGLTDALRFVVGF